MVVTRLAQIEQLTVDFELVATYKPAIGRSDYGGRSGHGSGVN